MKRLAAALSVVVAPLMLTAPAHAQGPGSDVVQVSAVDTSALPDVEVSILLPDDLAGRPLNDAAFALTEGGVPRQTQVKRQPGSEQDIVLAIDVSGGMSGQALADVKRAASDFVTQTPPGAHIGIVAISTRPEVISELTTDTAELQRKIAGLTSGGNSAISDSMFTAIDMLERGAAPNNVLVMLTDGADNTSTRSMSEVPDALRRSKTALYTVQMTTSETNAVALQQLTNSSRGQLATAGDTAALSGIYGSVAHALGNLYVLRYRSETDGNTQVVVSVRSGSVQQVSPPFSLMLPDTDSGPTAVPPAPHGFLASQAGMALGLVACYVALAAVALAITGTPAPRISAARGATKPDGESFISKLAERMVRLIDQRLRRSGRIAGRALALQQAGLSLRPGDYIMLVGAVAVTTAALGMLLSGPLLAIVFALLSWVGARFVLRLLTRRRRNAFGDQLDDSIQLLASSLRAGHSLLRALDAVSREAETPTAEEFARVVNETRVGRDLSESLHDVSNRMHSEDFEWIAQAIAINREVGGDLAGVLDQVANTIRERNQIRRQVKALAAEGKLSAYVLMALPFGITGFLMLMNPDYISQLTDNIVGYAMIGAGLVMLTVGGFWMSKVVSVKF